ncbi:hypothetical protein RND81_06G092000 [Saponaria officinalis]|uniref:Uncharacterized protein n=1 Tax=Saponaria officinalis TaxID=3572 RepID=A0AAW1K7Y2_SAPOF
MDNIKLCVFSLVCFCGVKISFFPIYFSYGWVSLGQPPKKGDGQCGNTKLLLRQK